MEPFVSATRPDAATRLGRLLEAGVESLRAGQLADARAMFLQVLDAAPGHPDAHALMANTAFLAGRMDDAEPHVRAAIAALPGRADLHVLYGNILQRAAQKEMAAQAYRHALQLRSDYVEAAMNLANVLGELERIDEALRVYDDVLTRRPDWLAAAYNRATLLKRAGRIAEARAVFAQLAARYPDSQDVLYALARTLQEDREPAQAETVYRRLLTLNPAHAQALNDSGLLVMGRNPAQALDFFERCIAADPGHVAAMRNAIPILIRQGRPERAAALSRQLLAIEHDDRDVRLRLARTLTEAAHFGEALRELVLLRKLQPQWVDVHLALAENYTMAGRFEKAFAANEQALAIDPANFAARVNQALIQGEMGDPAAAAAALEPILAERPDMPQLLNGLGVQYCALGRYADGIAMLERAVALDPNYPGAHNNLSFACLTVGDFERGWRHQGHKWGMRENRRFRRDMDCPLWRGEPLEGRTLFVWSEQGLGDQVMFASIFGDVIRRAGRCVLECNPRLETLFRRSFPDAEVMGKRPGNRTERRFDYHIPMSGLGEFLRNRPEDFPQHPGYLRADPERRSYWRNRLIGLGTGLKVGISWRGGTDVTERRARSIPLKDWTPVLDLPGARFVSLQYDDCRDELAAMRERGYELTHWSEAVDDLDECAALLCELDLVVSVTTTVIHMAGALARPVWVLVPARPGWRYLLKGDRLPWYPSARLLRQAEYGKWNPLIGRVRTELAARIADAG
jgi:tetratricopeptide (TPR) repeat protein